MASKNAHKAAKKFQKSPLFLLIFIVAVIYAIIKLIFGG